VTEPTIAEQIKALYELRERKRELNKKVDKIEEEIVQLKQKLIDKLTREGIPSARGEGASVTITREVVPKVVDRDAFCRYVRENDAFYLMQIRPLSTAFRESQRIGLEVPGLEAYERVNLAIRKHV